MSQHRDIAPPTVVIVDRNATARAQVREVLLRSGLATREATSLATMRRALREPADVVIADSAVTRENHAALLGAIRAADASAAVVLLVRSATLAQATEAVRRGADHLLARPVEPAALLFVVQRLVERQQARRAAAASHPEATRRPPDPFLGDSRAIRQLAEQAQRVVHSHAPILLQGETGTGKGVLASWLHLHGPRAMEAFVDINCASLSRELLESDLFGHARGAFTGAADAKQGLFEVAHRGTVFLDEVGELDLGLQPRLLKVLEDKRFRRLGEVRDRVVDVRLVTATHRDLAARSRDGVFRADLYYRINTVTLTVPSLRERREDIPVIAARILRDLGRPELELAADARDALVAHDWPGNIRELRNVLDHALIVAHRAPRLARKHLQLEVRPAPPRLARPDEPALAPFQPRTIAEAERRHVEETLRYVGGSVDRAAALLGVSRSALYKRLQRYR